MLSIKFVSVPVTNQDRALAWYTEKLGCTVVQDVPFTRTQRWIELAFPGGQSHIVLFTPPGFEDRVGGFHGISFTADDLAAVYQEMVAAGVEFMEPLRAAEWGGQQAIFRDSEGNQFVLASL